MLRALAISTFVGFVLIGGLFAAINGSAWEIGSAAFGWAMNW